ncbi:hypothetical protein AAF712_009531 [Marasmius tenuissimus]|uniref:Uncharacterized protein n=1 Tax=Marasmius tenuissimus TaxID=585030 RepID=A0ABR2ZQY0_9AGAR|nr:hypothetical protein PM082_006659 [Marasmius tenuissimus]
MQVKLVTFLALALPAIALPLPANVGDDISSVTSWTVNDVHACLKYWSNLSPSTDPLDDINNHVIGPPLMGLGVVKRGSSRPLADIH